MLPLPQQPAGVRVQAVLRGTDGSSAVPADDADGPKTSVHLPAATTLATPAAAPPQAGAGGTAARQRSDDNAERISTRLLQGWALMDMYCPR